MWALMSDLVLGARGAVSADMFGAGVGDGRVLIRKMDDEENMVED